MDIDASLAPREELLPVSGVDHPHMELFPDVFGISSSTACFPKRPRSIQILALKRSCACRQRLAGGDSHIMAVCAGTGSLLLVGL